MIPATAIREVKANGVQAKGVFSISVADSAHIMGILRDTMYSDKELAIMREYPANGWDAHRSIGKGDVPLKIHIPTHTDPTFTVRDFGPGMSEDEVFTIYPSYGASTKRSSNNMVGTLGIGSKSGFAYSDSFTVTSWNGGMKSVYVAYLDPSDRGEINKIASIPCGDETGLEIKIAVKPHDVPIFQRKAVPLFRYFSPRPDINIDLPDNEQHVTPHGFVCEDGERDWIALMGCIPYRLDLSQISPELEDAGIYHTLHRISGGLYFEIGDVQINASREELKYTDKTKEVVAAKIKALLEAYVEDTLAALQTDGTSGWDKRMKTHFLSGTLRIAIPKKYQEYTKGSVTLYETEKPKTFTLATPNSSITDIPVSDRTRVYFQDNNQGFKGYYFQGHRPVILCPVKGATRAAVVAEFETLCKAVDLDGMEIEDISACSWSSYDAGGSNRTPNKKHHIRAFRLKPDVSFCDPWSQTWEIEKREPQDNDTFVIIAAFKAVGWDGFHNAYRSDKRLAGKLGAELPPVYGYKTTAKKPLTRADCKGTHYKRWRISFFRGLVTDQHREIERLQGWVGLLTPSDEPYSYRRNTRNGAEQTLRFLSLNLGPSHPCTMLYRRVTEARGLYHKVKKDERETALAVVKAASVPDKPKMTEAEQVRDGLFGRYPLLKAEGLRALAGDDRQQWVEYIKLVDRDRKSGERLLLTAGKNGG